MLFVYSKLIIMAKKILQNQTSYNGKLQVLVYTNAKWIIFTFGYTKMTAHRKMLMDINPKSTTIFAW